VSKNTKNGKVVSFVLMVVLLGAVAVSFHLAKPARNSHTTAGAAEPAPQFAQSFGFSAESPEDGFATPSGWEKVTSASPTTAVENSAPSLPPLAPPPLARDPQREPSTAAPGKGATSTATADSVISSNSPNENFPTEMRVWTNYLGKLIVASVIECDFHTGELLMESENGILRTYQLTQLSDADRTYLWSLAKKED
jgi:hypothetical protein